MVTKEEINKRLEQLKQEETKQKSVQKKEIPVRRSGAGVDVRQRQEVVIQNRQIASQNISKIKDERKQLLTQKRKIEEYEREQARIEKQRREDQEAIKEYKQGRARYLEQQEKSTQDIEKEQLPPQYQGRTLRSGAIEYTNVFTGEKFIRQPQSTPKGVVYEEPIQTKFIEQPVERKTLTEKVIDVGQKVQLIQPTPKVIPFIDTKESIKKTQPFIKRTILGAEKTFITKPTKLIKKVVDYDLFEGKKSTSTIYSKTLTPTIKASSEMFIPENLTDIALLYGGAKVFKIAPKTFGAGVSIVSGASLLTAKTSEEKARARVGLFIGLGGVATSLKTFNKPTIKTSGKAVVTPKNKRFRVDVLTKTESERLNVVQYSRQIVKDTRKTTNIGLGKGIALSRFGEGKVKPSFFQVGGVNVNRGKARLFIGENALKGRGVRSSTLSRDTFKVVRGNKLKPLPSKLQPSDIAGVITKTGKKRFLFVGSLQRPKVTARNVILRENLRKTSRGSIDRIQLFKRPSRIKIKKSQIDIALDITYRRPKKSTKVKDNINELAIKRLRQKEKPTSVSQVVETIKPEKQKELPRNVEKSVISQVKSQQENVNKIASDRVTAQTRPLKQVNVKKTSTESFERTEQPTNVRELNIESQRDLSKSITKQRTTLKEEANERGVLRVSPTIKQQQRLRLNLRQRARLRQLQRARSINLPITPNVPTRIINQRINLQTKKQRQRQPKIQGRPTGILVLAPDLLGNIYGIERKIKKEEAIRIAQTYSTGLGIRGIPRIV